MSSVGQAVGYIGGAIIGAFIPGSYVMLGAAIGGMIGSAIDPPKGPKIEGPRLSDLTQQTASYGLPIARVYGTVAVHGNVFWIENNAVREVVTETEQGGKGGPSQTGTEYSYFGTFAVGLCMGPIQAVKRIWIGNRLFYNGVSDDTATIIESQQRASLFSVYYGTDDQEPDPRMQATLGIDSTPAYRGMAYIVFKDLPLADYGNSIVGTQVKVEVVSNATETAEIIEVAYNWTGYPLPASANPPTMIGVVDGLIEIQEIDASGKTYRVNPSGMTVADVIYRPLVQPVRVADDLESGVWGTVGIAYGNTYRVKHTAGKDYHGWGSGALCIGDIIRRGAAGMELIGSRIDQDIIACRVADGLSSVWWPISVAIDVRGAGIFVIDSDYRWYFVEPDGTVIDNGELSAGTSPYYNFNANIIGAFGAGNGQWAGSYTNKVCCFDSSISRYAHYDTSIVVWNIENGVLTLDSRTPLHAGMEINERAGNSTIWMDGDLVFGMVQHTQGNTIYVADIAHEAEVSGVNIRAIVEAECDKSRVLSASDIDASALDKMISGYRIGTVGALRGPLEQLQAYYPFDTFQSGYQIKFVPRGGASVATFDHSELVMSDGEIKSVLKQHRETDSQLPVKVSVKHLDAAREYDIGEQYAERYDDHLVNLREIELPLVMTPDQAAGVAQTLLYLYWLERYDVSFTLPPSLDGRKVQPADVITITTDDETLTVRLVTVESLPDGRTECAAKLASQTLYTPAAVGESPPTPPATLTSEGPTMATFLDVPYLMTGMDQPGFVGAMYSPMPTWTGGAFFNSNDGGATWTPITAVSTTATAGYATTLLAEPNSYQLVDTKNSLTVQLNGGSLESVTALQMFAGANHFALGVHGRWEICAAQTVVENADGTYTLSNLMRGRFGTEQFWSSHAVNDSFVLLDPQSVEFITVPINNIGLQKLWKAVGNNKALDSAETVPFTYTAQNLECLAPIRLRGHAIPGALDWSINWERRTRTPVEPFSGIATPLGETSEAYEVEIWDSNFTTLKRTITGLTSKSATWTASQQVEDFGSYQTEVYAKVYQLSQNVGRGVPLQGYLQHNVLTDPFFSNVVLLMHMNGANGGTTFTDEKGKPVTVYGGAQTSTAQSKFNGSSGRLDGTGDYLGFAASSDFDFGAGDFTWECWIYQVAVMTGTYADAIWCSQAGPVGFAVAIFSDGKIGITADSSAGGDWDIRKGCDPGDPRGATAIPLGTWVHVAVSRSGSNWYGFVNGVLDQTFTSSATISNAGSGYFLGHWHDVNARCFNGYIADLRVTKGICRYNSAFTPPSAPFPNS